MYIFQTVYTQLKLEEVSPNTICFQYWPTQIDADDYKNANIS